MKILIMDNLDKYVDLIRSKGQTGNDRDGEIDYKPLKEISNAWHPQKKSEVMQIKTIK